jgi:hypothetical protein
VLTLLTSFPLFQAPILKFSIGIFLTPALLSLLFVPLYLLDLRGFEFEDGVLPETPNPCNPLTSSDWLRGRPLCGQNTGWVVAYSVCYLFLYSLSLSTMFGGAPVQARSQYTLLVANLQTLVAQFAFVFLSGAGESCVAGKSCSYGRQIFLRFCSFGRLTLFPFSGLH